MTRYIKSLPAITIRKAVCAIAVLACALVAAVALYPATQAHAEVFNSTEKWTVTFTSNQKMESNFTSQEITEFVGTMQPGDTANISVTLRNKYSEDTDWYMTNKVISSLEESAASASGGVYTYNLTYTSPTGSRTTLFSSDTVGGDKSAGTDSGLHEATGALQNYFLLGSIGTDKSAKVDLTVALDGETQGNTYQNTLADLALDFAVEPTSEVDNPTTTTTPPNSGTTVGRLQQTGDTNLMIFVVCTITACVGLALLILAIVGLRKRKQNKGEVQ